MIKGIIFDLEGVIFDTESVWDEEIAIFLEKRGIEYNRCEMKHKFSGLTLEGGVELMKNEMFPKIVVGDTKVLAKERWDCFRFLSEISAL